jgi:hypothetical protein
MKQILCAFVASFVICSCCKKVETPDYAALIVGKWVCKSYQKDDADSVVNRTPYSMTGRYDSGWDFSANKQLRLKDNGGNWYFFEKDNYSLDENKTLTINSSDGNAGFEVSTFKISEFTATKLTVHSDLWKSTFFLLKE